MWHLLYTSYALQSWLSSSFLLPNYPIPPSMPSFTVPPATLPSLYLRLPPPSFWHLPKHRPISPAPFMFPGPSELCHGISHLSSPFWSFHSIWQDPDRSQTAWAGNNPWSVVFLLWNTPRSKIKETFSLPHQALQSQQVRSDTQTYAPGRWCQVEQTAWKHRWINVCANVRERNGNCPTNDLCARYGSAVSRAALQRCWADETSISRACPVSATAGLARPAKEKEGKHSFSGTAPPRGTV